MPPDLDSATDPEALRALALEAWQRAQALEAENRALTQEREALTQERQDLAKQKQELSAKNQELEKEIRVLLQRLSQLTRELAEARDADAQLALELELRRVQERLSNLNREKFGSSRSERRPRSDASDGDRKSKAKQKGHGPTRQPKLPIEEVVHPLDEADTCCPKCGGDLKVMAGQFEESELIVAVQRKYVVQRHKQEKCRCGRCGHIEAALGPQRLIRGGRYDLSFAVHVALDKYLDHLPLERQVRRMRRRGLEVTSQTLWDQLWALYLLLVPTLAVLHERVLQAPLLHADETPWRLMGKGRSSRWWVWTLVGEQGVYMDILPTRGSPAAQHILQGYDGTVVADGYGVYTSLEKVLEHRGGEQLGLTDEAEVLPNYTLAACWSHARRPLVQAEKNAPEVSEALDLIGKLYQVEAEARKLSDGDEAALLEHRRRLRAEQSRVLIDQLDLWRTAQRPLPGTKHAKGVTYLSNQWPRLTRFLDNPRIPLDNNKAERALRTPVLGRKNHLGSRSERGIAVAALFYSLLGTCRHLGVDPDAWLTEAAGRALADRTAILLPQDYAAELADADAP